MVLKISKTEVANFTHITRCVFDLYSITVLLLLFLHLMVFLLALPSVFSPPSHNVIKYSLHLLKESNPFQSIHKHSWLTSHNNALPMTLFLNLLTLKWCCFFIYAFSIWVFYHPRTFQFKNNNIVGSFWKGYFESLASALLLCPQAPLHVLSASFTNRCLRRLPLHLSLRPLTVLFVDIPAHISSFVHPANVWLATQGSTVLNGVELSKIVAL